ncbi:MAG TPA: biotin transporter BioY [Spirochaetales bacterium]|nr:biotin transporter BioY [Spirochaetales bacterium]
MTRTQRAAAGTASAIFAAAIAAAAFIHVPVPLSPVPVVIQNLLAVLAGLVLGPRYGSFAVALFLAAGALGAPVFSGGRGGWAVLLGPSGGYLAGYLAGAFAAGLVMRSGRRSVARSAIASVAGFAAVYLVGVGRLATLPGSNLAKAVAGGLLPFLAVDAVKAAAAAAAAYALEPFAASLFGLARVARTERTGDRNPASGPSGS